jgi:RNA-directed DNA polymerase
MLKAIWLTGSRQGHSACEGASYHLQPQAKNERWHEILKNLNPTGNHYFPDIDRQIGTFAEHRNHVRYHESIENVTPPTFTSAERRRFLQNADANRRLQHEALRPRK